MPSLDFPRLEYVMQVLRDVSGLSVPGPYISRSQSGKLRTRESGSAGHSWSEDYGQISFRRPETHEFLSYINWAWKNGITFNITHPLTPGSGEPHIGTAPVGATVTVSGAGQTGDSLVTAGWPASTANLLLPGNVIRVAGVDRVFIVTDPVTSDGGGTATIKINPPIFVGSSPTSGAAVTYNNVKLKAKLSSQPELPTVDNTFYYSNIVLNFTEAV